jgi:DNA-binding beta-propeller fold protein YncE
MWRLNTVSGIDTVSNTMAADIETDYESIQVESSPDGKFVYVSLNGENVAGKIDAAQNTVVGKVAVDANPVQLFVTPDGLDLLVAEQGTVVKSGAAVSLVDTAAFSDVVRVKAGDGPTVLPLIPPAGWSLLYPGATRAGRRP